MSETKEFIPLQIDTIDEEVEIVKIERYKELLQELVQLKEIVTDLNTIVTTQNESINKVVERVDNVKTTVEGVDKELNDMKKAADKSSKFQFVTNYIIPGLTIAATYSPVFYLAGPKVGFMASATTYLFFKFM